MRIIELPLSEIKEPLWNPNFMDERTKTILRKSIQRFGLGVPLAGRH